MITAEMLRELLDYDPETGVFTWRMSRSRSAKAGEQAGTLSFQGYITITISGRKYKAHRLAFLHVEGSFPPEQVDHINGVRTDNRMVNLRHASHAQNLSNCKVRADNSCGTTGICWVRRIRKWQAKINIDGKTTHLGYFRDKGVAAEAYERAAFARSGEFAPRQPARIGGNST